MARSQGMWPTQSMVLQLLAGMDTGGYEFEADVNMDGKIGLAEAVHMMQLISLGAD